MLSKGGVSITEKMSPLGRLTSSAIAVLSAPLQYQKKQQIIELSAGKNFESMINLSPSVKEELN
jgi:hypothetical protein